MVSALIILAGLGASVLLSIVLSVALEMLMSIGKLHAAAGGFALFIWGPIAFVCALIASGVGLFAGATGWSLFFYPIYGCLAWFAFQTLLWLAGKVFGWDD